jgi:hypothetical protein
MNANLSPIPHAEHSAPPAVHSVAPVTVSAGKWTVSRTRDMAIVGLFAMAMLIPKIIHLRRSQRSWFAFRIALAVVGASFVLLPLALWNSYLISVLGLAMFTCSILLPSARPDTTIEEKARELGALTVVNGGQYQPGNALPAAVQLFASVDNIWALDEHYHPLLVVPVRELTSAHAECTTKGNWFLRIAWADHAAEFSYRGIFAGHRAHIAERALQSVMRPLLVETTVAKSRAASA